MFLEARGCRQVELVGIVDSGAGRFGDASEASVSRFGCTVLSLQDAEELGLHDLREAPDATLAGGIHIPTWISDTPIRAQVKAPLSPGGPFEAWGPVIDLHPIFLQAGRPLWGQEDLYASFRIIAERYVDPAIAPAYFELEYWASMSEGEPRPSHM